MTENRPPGISATLGIALFLILATIGLCLSIVRDSSTKLTVDSSALRVNFERSGSR